MSVTDDLATVRYARMRWNTPLAEAHGALLVERFAVPDGAHVLDLGCGWGELLLRAVDAGGAHTTGTGVDTDGPSVDRARTLAKERGLDARVTFARQGAATWQDPADRVMCVGAAQGFGGTVAALDGLTRLVRPGGRLLFGEAFWERPTTIEATELLGEEITPLPELVERVRARGWRVLHLSTADQREWDDFESTALAGRQEWLLHHPDGARATEVRCELDARLREYVCVYRGLLGMAYLVLARADR
ncbi:SAM-dependent methyltransferase [Phytohabitans houttuyneae]|uniref:SAM-dependent methyltransferase n=1 Tax=Phytohabitans houttuyneae TaxID=1076126 RepID=A0A6V8KUB1_9ACTN|nr:class I SAM-dependent methyltransferase [Phytohabitans houttuyneae]GFJ85931.1 SAM-dependent methyltransferase [Phytohabitans houttuyneae]